MSAFLLKFEAIESRIASSYSCPPGTPGRVHALRLRRCFQQSSRCQSTSLGIRTPLDQSDARTYLQVEEKAEYNVQAVQGRDNSLEQRIAELRDLRKRYSHSQTLWDPYNYGQAVLNTGSTTSSPIAVSEESEHPTQSLEPARLVSGLHTSLRSGDPNRVLEEILGQMKAVGPMEYARAVFATVPATTFSEILLTLDPKNFVGQVSEIFKEISPAWNAILRLPPINEHGHYEFLAMFLRHISTIVSSRETIHPLSISDYKHLLKWTRMAGDSSTAKFIWRKMHQSIHESIAAAEIDPSLEVLSADVECYNHYVATLCWSEMSNPLQRHRLRIIPRNFVPRTWETQQFLPLQGHSVGANGLKTTVASNFRVMVQQKVQPNEETFCLMLVSVARERDLTSIASILKRVWGIDVEAVLASEESEDVPKKSYHLSDPLYPSNRLLMALAHAYSINNSIPTAIRLVDYVARQYNLTISRDIWSELLERTYMLAAFRGRNPPEGQLAPVAVSNLWVTMTAEPYNVQPDLRMYNYFISSLIRRQCYREVQTRMDEALEIHRADVLELSNRVNTFNRSDTGDQSRQILAQRARDLAYQHLRVKINRQYIRRWVRLLIHRGAKDLRGTDTFAYQNMPNIVRDWALFLPQVVHYKTPSGLVSLSSQARLLNQIHQEKYIRRNKKWINTRSQVSWTGHKRMTDRVAQITGATLGPAQRLHPEVSVWERKEKIRAQRRNDTSPPRILRGRKVKAERE